MVIGALLPNAAVCLGFDFHCRVNLLTKQRSAVTLWAASGMQGMPNSDCMPFRGLKLPVESCLLFILWNFVRCQILDGCGVFPSEGSCSVWPLVSSLNRERRQYSLSQDSKSCLWNAQGSENVKVVYSALSSTGCFFTHPIWPIMAMTHTGSSVPEGTESEAGRPRVIHIWLLRVLSKPSLSVL